MGVVGKASMENQTNLEEAASNAEFIDEAELLKRLPISRRTAFAWTKAGKLPVVRVGRRKLYHWKSVSEALLRIQRGAALSS